MFSRLAILLALLALTVSASAQQPPASQSFPSYVLGKSLATTPLGSADYVPVIQGGVTRRVRGTDIGGGGSGITGTFGDSTHVPQCTFANGSATLCTNVLITGGSGTGANPTATASDVAVNGVALTFMRSDAAPLIQKGTNAAFGLIKGDGSTITCVAGVCSSLTGGAGTVTNASNLTDHAPVIGNGGTVGIKTIAALTNGQVMCGATGADPTACTVSGDGIMAAGGSLTITKTSGVNFSTLATTAPGTGVATALGVNVGSAGAFVVNGGAGGTPSSITLTNGVSLPAATGLSGNVAVGNGGTGTGTMTANALVKGNGASAYSASAISDDGTKISLTEPLDLTSKALEREFANAGVTGTTLNKLAKLTSAPSTAVITATTDTDGAIGIVTGGAGTTSSARIALAGQASCIFDGSTTAGDFVIISPSVAGDCRDGGSTRPTGAQTIGRVTSTNAAGGTFVVDLDLGFANTAGGAGIVVSGTTAGTANAQTMAASFSFLDGNVVVAKIGTALTNTASATLNVNSTGVKAVAIQDATGALTALVGGELAAGGTYALVAHTSCPAPISADCYTIMTTPGSGAPITASATVTTSQWNSFTPANISIAAQTITLPAATTLSTSGGLPISAVGNSITLQPNSADGINGGTVNVPVTIPAGTFTLVSSTGSSGTGAIKVAIPSAVAGAVTQIGTTQTAASSADLRFTSLGAYKHRTLKCTAILPATNAQGITLQFSEDAGSTWKTTYSFALNQTSTGQAFSQFSTAGNSAVANLNTGVAASAIFMTGAQANTGDTASFDVDLKDLDSTTVHKTARFRSSWNDGTNLWDTSGTGWYIADTSAVTGIRVISQSGNITSGSCSLYGWS